MKRKLLPGWVLLLCLGIFSGCTYRTELSRVAEGTWRMEGNFVPGRFELVQAADGSTTTKVETEKTTLAERFKAGFTWLKDVLVGARKKVIDSIKLEKEL